jgi:hypothetical protein
MGKPKKYAAVSGAKKDFLTVAKITRSDHPRFAFALMARFDAPSNDQIYTALALIYLTNTC